MIFKKINTNNPQHYPSTQLASKKKQKQNRLQSLNFHRNIESYCFQQLPANPRILNISLEISLS